MKTVQYFDDAYLEQCRNFSAEDVVEYLENFRLLQQASASKTRLISIKVPKTLLNSFKAKSKLHNVKYQTQIKSLMRDWLLEDNKSK